LAQLKSGIAKKVEQYNEKKDDPFYKVEDRNTRLTENSKEYVIEARVPEHEKDAIKIKVSNDKVVVAGSRSFKDKVDHEDRKLSTQSYQSFREEIPLEYPVVTEAVTQTRDGDILRVTIPKLDSSFRRKA